MDCPKCGHANLPETAKFCPECGTKRLGASRPAETQIQITQQVGEGKATGLEVGEIRGSVTVVHGHVFHINDPSPELLEKFVNVRALPTEVTPRPDAEAAGQPDPERIAVLEGHLKEILDHVRVAEQRGETIEEVQVGSMQLPRVELLLKQAVLLTTEADQMWLDQLHRNKQVVDQAKARSTGPTFEIDLSELLAGFDETAQTAKLREAYGLLEDANRLDPTNAEVLLHMAQLMDRLEHDPPKTQRILLKVQNLLHSPRNDTDRFHLAQAKFLSAISGDHVHPDELRNARDMFARLGRSDWVQHCDSILPSAGHSPPSTAGALPGAQPQFRSAEFQPVGQWQAQMSNGGTLLFALHPGGMVQGVQRFGVFAMQVPFSGQWSFDPRSRVLLLQGLVQGISPFMFQILIQGQQGEGYRGVGSDGLQYFLTRSAW